MKTLRTLNNALLVTERSLLVVLLSVMILLAFLQVILRNYFSTGFLWADPFLRHMVLWVGFFGASLATQKEKHINIDVITRFASPRSTNFVRIATNAFALIVCFALANAGWTFLRDEMESGSILLTFGTTEIPAWLFQSIIPFGFGLMAFRFGIRVLERVIEAYHPTKIDSMKTNLPETTS